MTVTRFVLAAVATAAIGAVVGVAVNNYATRPHVAVQLCSTEIFRPTTNTLLGLTLEEALNGGIPLRIHPNPDLIEITESSTWLPSLADVKGKYDYLSKLLNASETAQDVKERMVECRKGLKDKWPADANRSKATDIFMFLREHDVLISAHLFGEARLSRVPLLPQSLDRLGDAGKAFEIDTSESGAVIVERGQYKLPFAYGSDNQSEIENGWCRTTALRAGKAVQMFDSLGMAELRKLIEKMFQEEGELDEFSRLAHDEMALYSNWSVKCIVQNNGGSPISIYPRGILHVKSNGKIRVPVAGTEKELTVDEQVEMQVVDEQKTNIGMTKPSTMLGEGGGAMSLDFVFSVPRETPIMIHPGEAVALDMRSVETINDHPSGKTLLGLFDLKTGVCSVSILELGTVDKVKPSTERLFRAWVSTDEFPRFQRK